MLQKISGIEKCQGEEREREGGASRLSLENLLSHRTEQLRAGNLCFRKFLVSKNVKDKRERGHHGFPSKHCCLTVPKNFAGKLVFQKISGIEKCQGEERERGGHHDFPSKICCLTVPSNFVGETCVSENFWYRKMLRIREKKGGGITTFCRKFVVSQYRKTS